MKNADDMLKAIVQIVDTNGDGKIQYDGMLQTYLERNVTLLTESLLPFFFSPTRISSLCGSC